MGAPKYNAKDLKNLFSQSESATQKQNLQDKKYIETIKNRLDSLLQDPKMAKKAALIIEKMINDKQKKP